MSSQPVALILGSGPRVGAAVAKKFASLGFTVATASRNGTGAKTTEGFVSLKADLSDVSSVQTIFDAVKAKLKSAPSVVVYNGAALTPPRGDDLFSVPVKSLSADLNTNTVSVYAAAQRAVREWETLAPNSKKVFIYTGNRTYTAIAPILLTVT